MSGKSYSGADWVPVTRTLEEADELAELEKRFNTLVHIGHIERFNPACQELRTILSVYPPLAINFQRLSSSAGVVSGCHNSQRFNDPEGQTGAGRSTRDGVLLSGSDGLPAWVLGSACER